MKRFLSGVRHWFLNVAFALALWHHKLPPHPMSLCHVPNASTFMIHTLRYAMARAAMSATLAASSRPTRSRFTFIRLFRSESEPQVLWTKWRRSWTCEGVQESEDFAKLQRRDQCQVQVKINRLIRSTYLASREEPKVETKSPTVTFWFRQSRVMEKLA